MSSGAQGVASADHWRLDGQWTISRVFVRPEHRGAGLGSRLLERLKTEVARMPGFWRLEVAPGGYDVDPVRQRDFYVQHGFRPSASEPDLLIWDPSEKSD